ncbi:uncharacterized protein NEMAJ01_0778 [Nematocida major]|uniref:uncharacterized protein n=1 Tax=Nematocida major TaxID=1912982 RepID=UPI002007B8C6|nr:uncharacterized protein NEMAJ01_0778 [Nematocida major]KAH9385882.1 hypothetical protein NEMAJ01_0778 [Nematocida major]
MRVQLIIAEMLLFCLARGRLSLDQLEELETLEIEGRDKTVYVNPRGSLNFLHGYMHRKNGHMHNVRLFSPEVKTNYCLEISPRSQSVKDKFRYKRAPLKDVAYYKNSQNVSAKTMLMQCTSIVKMFPSEGGVLSIESSNLDSFTNFLRAFPNQKSIYGLLAALLLLSEGVSLNIRVSGAIISLYKANGNPLFLLSEIIASTTSHDTSEGEVPYSLTEVGIVVDFFKQAQKKRETPKRTKEYATGEFLGTPWFIIQSYIYEYIESVDAAKEVILSVHEILANIIENVPDKKENKKVEMAKYVYKKLFVSLEKMQAEKSLHAVKLMKYLVMSPLPFPFSHFNELPACRMIPPHIRHKRGKDAEFRPQYSQFFMNYAENALYTLMCSLLYSQEFGKYSTEKLSNNEGARDLKMFFVQENPSPGEVVDLSLHKAWNSVVSCLSSLNIRYLLRSRNQICCGLLNMLLVIAEITGKRKTQENTILDFMKTLKKDSAHAPSFYLYLQNYVSSFLRTLIVGNNVEVECVGLTKGIDQTGEYDVFGEIHVKYRVDAKEDTLAIRVGAESTSSEFIRREIALPEKTLKSLKKLSQKCKKRGTFLGLLSCQYAKGIGQVCDSEVESTIASIVKKILHGTEKDRIDTIFALRKIEGLKYKKLLVDFSVGYSVNYWGHASTHLENSGLSRLALNILGSTPLENVQTQKMFFPIFIYTGSYYLLQRKIDVPVSEYNHLFSGCDLFMDLLIFASTNTLCNIIWHMVDCSTLEEKHPHRNIKGPLEEQESMRIIFSTLITNSPDCVVYKLPKVNAYCPKEEKVPYSLLNLAIFSFVCRYRKDDLKTINAIYDCIMCTPKETHFVLRKRYCQEGMHALSYMRDNIQALQKRKLAKKRFALPIYVKHFGTRRSAYKYRKVRNFFMFREEGC